MHVSEYIESLIKKDLKVISIIFLLLIIGISFSQSIRAEIDLMGLTMDIRESGIDVSSGNISVEIYDAASAGNLIYNSSDAFLKEANKKGELNNG